MLLTENYNIKKEVKIKQGGGNYTIAYIDPKTSDSLYGKNEILKKYNAKPNMNVKPWVWFWFLGETPESQQMAINKYIKPCLVELNNAKGEDDEIMKAIDDTINKLSTSTQDEPMIQAQQGEGQIQSDSKEDIQEKLKRFKNELVSAMTDSDFKAKLEPILKFRNAQGHKYSFSNTILIWIQDPHATLVKSRSNWMAANREIIPNARAIAMWVIKSMPKGAKDRSAITANYLQSIGKTDLNALNITEREELKILLKDINPNFFSLVPAFFDISQTKQIEGKEDMMGSKPDDIKWFEEGMEDERASIIYSSLLEFAKEKHLEVKTAPNIDGARGSASATGQITILDNNGKDVGLTKTLAHEISHELLHFSYANSKDPSLKTYFLGREQGRAKVEQQAEVSAWIVMKNFNFDLPTSINYISLWGADEKSVVAVFDQVAKVANILIEYVESKMKMVRLESEQLGDGITGLDVAKLLGAEDLYLKYKGINEIKESFYKILNRIN